MKKLLTTGLVLTTLVIAGCGGGTAKYTMEKFNQVQPGMTYEQVKDIMGDPGKMNGETKSPSIEGVMDEITIRSYQWQNSDGSNMIVSFTNNQVDTKAQAGLK